MKKGNKIRRSIAFSLSLVILAGLALSGCGRGGPAGDGDTVNYGIWLLNGEDSYYFDTYDKNPAIEYLLTKTWGPENKKVDLEFFIPVDGTQGENFNTLLATGDYPDMMDATMYGGSLIDLYEQGIILDLTDLINEHMPNYRAFLEANPEIAQQATHVVNGESKYLTLRKSSDELGEMWGGYMYRRDWIVKYGSHPVNGSSFSGSYTGTLPDGSVDMNSWEDNVVFPSGGPDPVYISDWEWMLEIFADAIADLGISDGYPMSLYFPGYLGTGDLVSAFGGSGPVWHKTPDGQIEFGATGENFRVYLQAMNTWFKNGWIDRAFAERSTDMFFRIDETRVRSGKVGLWWGGMGQLIGNMDDGEGLKAGMVVYGARQPINDIYGTAAQQNIEPYTMYQLGRANNSWILTDKLKDKDIVPLLTLLDHLYSDEGRLLGSFGLNQAQYEVTLNELYTRYGLTEGSYFRVPDERARGSRIYSWVDTVHFDGGMLASAVKSNRFFFLDSSSLFLHRGTEAFINSLDQWIWYRDTGNITGAIRNQITPDEQRVIARTSTNIDEFMARTVPTFIRGERDPFSDSDWNSFVNALDKFNPDAVTVIYQEKQDNLK